MAAYGENGYGKGGYGGGAEFVPRPGSARFFWQNRWSDQTLGSITASSSVAAFPVSNTQLKQRSKVWRSTTLGSQFVQRNLGAQFRIGGVALVSHNLTVAGQFRVRISNEADISAPLYDSDFIDAWEKTFDIESEFSDGTGKPTADGITLMPLVVRTVVFDEVYGQYIRIDFLDSGNADNYIELAYVYAGIVTTIDPNMLYGWSIHRQDVARVKSAASGQLWIDSLHRKYVAQSIFAGQPESKAGGFWMHIFNLLGTSKEFVVSFRANEAPWRGFTTLYCRLANTPELINVAANAYSTSQLTFEEIP